MKTAGRESPNSSVRLCNEPSPWGGRPEPSLLNQTGWRVRKNPVIGEVFFLTSPYIELLGTWPRLLAKRDPNRFPLDQLLRWNYAHLPPNRGYGFRAVVPR